jgi:hypothetical protein
VEGSERVNRHNSSKSCRSSVGVIWSQSPDHDRSRCSWPPLGALVVYNRILLKRALIKSFCFGIVSQWQEFDFHDSWRWPGKVKHFLWALSTVQVYLKSPSVKDWLYCLQYVNITIQVTKTFRFGPWQKYHVSNFLIRSLRLVRCIQFSGSVPGIITLQPIFRLGPWQKYHVAKFSVPDRSTCSQFSGSVPDRSTLNQFSGSAPDRSTM